ncbi:NAD dependent epimerase/dehydratase family protein [Metarhizium album ARSEF 1941]|uniref:NAD dependent epimerase/dehydratase family protein n=1 Tax=Metarhizium album (strain ARSEF 1941) TaxID=1081103 RepID=A0A0B2WMT2_METAS|nr:NAD dependent epimerase/dehydratase family protein [Metarhizium album ARSEF 1941]KHN94782.1 NAD dependent epimerase/dehydratase family protein [Metarhizium album ARSEF 1941]
MKKSQVFVVGPGYTGREIIDLLLLEDRYEVTTLVRRESAIAEFQKDGVKAVLGHLDDVDVIQQLSAKSDIIFHTATADHLESAQAILAGIEERANQGKQSIYLHQSGTGVLSDSSPGNNVNNEVFSDKTPAQIDTLASTAPHRKIDLGMRTRASPASLDVSLLNDVAAILEARQKLGSKARIFIWMPPLIYGSNSRHKRHSIQVPALTRFALKHGQAGYVGTGTKTWGVVHVRDLAKAYVQVLHWAETAPDSDPELQNPYFFCESAQVTWGEVSAIVGKGLHKAGRIATPDARPVLESEYGDLLGRDTPDVVGSNSRNRADRLRAMGWTPEHLGLDEAFEKEDLPELLLSEA